MRSKIQQFPLGYKLWINSVQLIQIMRFSWIDSQINHSMMYNMKFFALESHPSCLRLQYIFDETSWWLLTISKITIHHEIHQQEYIHQHWMTFSIVQPISNQKQEIKKKTCRLEKKKFSTSTDPGIICLTRGSSTSGGKKSGSFFGFTSPFNRFSTRTLDIGFFKLSSFNWKPSEYFYRSFFGPLFFMLLF